MRKIEALWNEYVPDHLLPRLHGYELLMAPYAIAHLEIGLKLYECLFAAKRHDCLLQRPHAGVAQRCSRGIEPAVLPDQRRDTLAVAV
jgi:hypothetical protein